MFIVKYVIGLLILIGHLKAYNSYYINIGTSFVVTFALKKIINSMNKDLASMFGLAGYCVVLNYIVKLLIAISGNGFNVDVKDIINNLDGLDKIKID